ncbi:transglutaminase superfamily protein [Chitinophaga dinghuensis]|uniref:Transglutaminase superfamily protein n=1 Tax=Chitinophaga dinghuensis TaxID=1539050 RepID=A0A327WDU1_9BACT|nr:DUF3857 domain-containing protein [Chitinophaga dinghuensis]RAJ85556.1 transglutaminase superfamily protein [Chitinophaga dinghuensis]
MRSYQQLAVICLLMFITPFALLAQNKKVFTGPAPDWLVPHSIDSTRKPDAKNISDGAYILLQEDQKNVEKHIVYEHIIRQIVSETGIQNGSEISVDFDPAYEKLVFHHIIVRRDGKSINQLQSTAPKLLQQEQELSRFIYSGTYTAYYILEDIRKGDQIDYAYSIEGRNPVFPDKIDQTTYLLTFEPIVNYYRCLLIHPARHIQMKSFYQAALPKTKAWKEYTCYEWTSVPQMQSETRDFVPSWYTWYPKVQLNEYGNWREIAQWGLQISTVPAPGPGISRKIEQLKQLAKGDKEKYLLQALRFVQDDIRYMGIELGENSHKPNSPEKVLQQRFGDCKDKSLLLCSLLQAAGISASMAYVSTDMKGKVADLLPTPFAFNHVITAVSLNHKTYWLDATATMQRGTLETFCEPDYQLALIIHDSTTQLTPIIQRTHGKLVVKEIFTLPDLSQHTGELKVETACYREEADDLRNNLAAESQQDKDKTYLDYYRGLYGSMRIKDSMRVADNPDSNIMRVYEHYEIENIWKRDTITGKLQFTSMAQFITDALPEVKEDRHVPLRLRYPYDLDYTIVIRTPGEWPLNLEPLDIVTNSYRMQFIPEKTDNEIRLHYILQTLKDHVPVNEIPQYIKDSRKFTDYANMNLKARSDSQKDPGKQPNWLTIFLAFVFAGLIAFLAIAAYKRSLPTVETQEPPIAIGGGLAILAIALVCSPITDLTMIIRSGIFRYDIWVETPLKTTVNNVSSIQLMLVVELFLNILFLGYSVLLAVLFFHRRDTFPLALATYYVLLAIYLYADRHLANMLFKEKALPDMFGTDSVLWPLVKMAIWIPYLKISGRARATFVIPYPTGRVSD